MQQKTVALVAHDHKKSALLNWVKTHQAIMQQCTLVATGTTGTMLAERTGLPITRYQSGPLGGDQQIGALTAEGRLDALFFFWDPLNPAPHDPDVKALLRLCSVWNVPVACNESTADMLVTSPLFLSADYQLKKPQFQEPEQTLQTLKK